MLGIEPRDMCVPSTLALHEGILGGYSTAEQHFLHLFGGCQTSAVPLNGILSPIQQLVMSLWYGTSYWLNTGLKVGCLGSYSPCALYFFLIIILGSHCISLCLNCNIGIIVVPTSWESVCVYMSIYTSICTHTHTHTYSICKIFRGVCDPYWVFSKQ